MKSNRIKSHIFLAAAAAGLLLSGYSLKAEGTANYFDTVREYPGIATSLATVDLKYGYNDEYRGIIWYTATPGEIFHGPILDDKGNVIKEGSAIIKMYTDYPEAKVKEKEALLEQAKAELTMAQEDYIRFSKLVKSHSVSVQDFEKAQSAYFSNQAAVRAAETELQFRKLILKLCTYNAEFDGIVNKVYLSSGVAAGEPKVLNVSQLVPMGILVKMDRNLSAQISTSTPVTVYPDPSISKEPVGIAQGYSYLTDDGIVFEIPNRLVVPKVMDNGKPVPVVSDIHIIIGDERQPNLLALNSMSFHKDSKGDFVWKAIGQQSLVPGAKISKIFAVKKVYLELTGKQLDYSPGNRLVIFKKTPEFKLYDIVVTDVPEGYEDGGKVTYYPARYTFMPGDKVKVVIGPTKK